MLLFLPRYFVLLALLTLASRFPILDGVTIRRVINEEDDDDDDGEGAFGANKHAFIDEVDVIDEVNETDLWTEHDRMEEDLYINVPQRIPDGVDLGSSGGDDSTVEISHLVTTALMEGSGIQDKINQLFQKAKTAECRETIAEHFGYFLAALGREEHFPFSGSWELTNSCPEPIYDKDNLPEGVDVDDVMEHTYQPSKEEDHTAEYIDDPSDLRLLYAVLTHDDPDSTIRLIEALHEPGHLFVIHVDGKETSEATYEVIQKYAASLDHVHVLTHPYRVRVNWGGFSMVNATLQMLRYSFGLLPDLNDQVLDFHRVVHLSSTTYPIASNAEIRQQLAKFPLDANLLHLINFPLRTPRWAYFVECDDAVHRIYHLQLPTSDIAGFDLYTASQWWIISRDFAYYLAAAVPGTFVYGFLDYAEHVVVADETFFGTVLKNTEFCTTFHYRNYNYVEFDRWESDLSAEHRDLRKCPMKDPNICGRSASVMRAEDAPILELDDNLFARKFVQSEDENIKDIVDQWRADRDLRIVSSKRKSILENDPPRGRRLEFDGHGVLIVAKDTVGDATPLCLGVDEKENNNNVWLTPCFYESVAPTLESGWEAGTVVLEQTHELNRWDFSPCSTSHGHLEFIKSNGSVHVARSTHSKSGPRCMMTPMGRPDHCLQGYDKQEENIGGGEVYLDYCASSWSQLVSFGDGTVAPERSLFMTVPHYLINEVKLKGEEQHKFMCLGVRGRGNQDEALATEETEEGKTHNDMPLINAEKETILDDENVDWPPLGNWADREIRLTHCKNQGAIIEWIFVPYTNNTTRHRPSRKSQAHDGNFHRDMVVGVGESCSKEMGVSENSH